MWEMLVLFLLRGLFDLQHNQQQIEFSSAWAASRLPRGIQRAESLRELKLCQEEQTGGKPRPLPLQWGNHSLLNVDVVYWVTSILVAWLVEHGHADLSRGSWISMMLAPSTDTFCVSGVKCRLAKWLNLFVWGYQRELFRFSEYFGQWALLTSPGGVFTEMWCGLQRAKCDGWQESNLQIKA